MNVLGRYQCVTTVVDSIGRNGVHWTCETFAIGYTEYLLNAFRDLLNFFLESGGNINAKDDNGMTGLMIVVQKGGEGGIIKVLLELGAYVDERDHRGRTALHIAVENDNAWLVGTLLEHGAFPEARDNDGQSPLHKAAALGREKLTDRLLKASSSSNFQDTAGASPLHLAALSGNGRIVRQLVYAGENPNLADEMGQTPLHIAARKISYGALEAMLDCGADKGLKDRFGDARPTAQDVLKDEELESKLFGRVFLVTGASAGLGVETVKALAMTGATIFAAARDFEKAKQALEGIPGNI
ncbi:hypothetical protein N0V94_007793 [Neodidymelliopsis sp. IMI 364377]|nr:hypothetical protein N0V94_007793 [Neodidymelliopsis sp. IMI 364377]